MAPGDDQLLGNLPGGEAPSGQEHVANNGDPNSSWEVPSQAWNMPGNVHSAGAENFFDGNMDGGLYWLWDMTWTGAET